jgi:hypothetical protein
MAGPLGGIIHQYSKDGTGSTEYLADDSMQMQAYTSIPQFKKSYTERIAGGEPTISFDAQIMGGDIESCSVRAMYDKKHGGVGPVWEVTTSLAYSGVTSL